MHAGQDRRGEAGTGRPKALCALTPNQAGKAGVREGRNPCGLVGSMTRLSRLSRRPEAGEGSPIRPPEPPRGNQAHACMNWPGRKMSQGTPRSTRTGVPTCRVQELSGWRRCGSPRPRLSGESQGVRRRSQEVAGHDRPTMLGLRPLGQQGLGGRLLPGNNGPCAPRPGAVHTGSRLLPDLGQGQLLAVRAVCRSQRGVSGRGAAYG
ncbi:MAG: hypothetical protein FD177_286 [Desulfovibrionaceae bacterium]|nr:MAG: hypothetical protein FD177_286 [Desulfovibrionaceae bacterium]